VSEKDSIQYSRHNFDKFRQSFAIFDMNRLDTSAVRVSCCPHFFVQISFSSILWSPSSSVALWCSLWRLFGDAVVISSQCAFSVAGPSVWNSLPADLRLEPDAAAVFKHKLKSYFFRSVFTQ